MFCHDLLLVAKVDHDVWIADLVNHDLLDGVGQDELVDGEGIFCGHYGYGMDFYFWISEALIFAEMVFG